MADRRVSRRLDEQDLTSHTEDQPEVQQNEMNKVPTLARHYDPAHPSQSHIGGSSSFAHSYSSVSDYSLSELTSSRSLPRSDYGSSPADRASTAHHRDSGYNTEVSPATTCSPAHALTTSGRTYFDFIEPEPPLDGPRYARSLPNSAQLLQSCETLGTPQSQQTLYERRSRRSQGTVPPLRLSPDIFRVASTPRTSQELFDNNETDGQTMSFLDCDQLDFDSEDEINDAGTASSSSQAAEEQQEQQIKGCRRDSSVRNFDSSGNFIGRQSSSNDSTAEEEDEESFFASAPERYSRFRKDSFSLRARRFCSEPNIEELTVGSEKDLLGAGIERQSNSPKPFTFTTTETPLGNPLNREQFETLHRFSDCQISPLSDDCGNSRNSKQPARRLRTSSPLHSSGGFETKFLDDPENEQPLSDSGDDDDVFTFDFDEAESVVPNPRISPGGPQTQLTHRVTVPKEVAPQDIVRDRPPQSPASQERRRLAIPTPPIAVQSGVRLAGLTGTLVSASTQTPHQASLLMRQVLETPVVLQNEARGTVVSRLRRMSESGAVLPPSPVPLPDIIPLGRDRSLSAPDPRAASRQRARIAGREVGRELRRLSDEFNLSFRGRMSPVHEERNGFSASCPGMSSSFIQRTVRFTSYLRETFSRRSGSSVDLSAQADDQLLD